jgi:catechol 2,3-dioxygenase-like lactoylglutathione lyase family enzyme
MRAKIRAMPIKCQVCVTFDTDDIEAESDFWAGVLGGTVAVDDEWHSVIVDGTPRIGVQFAPNYVRPDWPYGTPPQQVHLDLWVDDPEMAHEEVTALGANLLKKAAHYQVYSDPAGHPFCVCWINK